jgi:hypothetical protein
MLILDWSRDTIERLKWKEGMTIKEYKRGLERWTGFIKVVRGHEQTG